MVLRALQHAVWGSFISVLYFLLVELNCSFLVTIHGCPGRLSEGIPASFLFFDEIMQLFV